MAEYGMESPVVIGSGGNINRLYKLAGGVGKKPIHKADLEATHAQLQAASMRSDRPVRIEARPGGRHRTGLPHLPGCHGARRGGHGHRAQSRLG